MEKKKNTPKLRFPEFTEEWEEKKLGEIGDIITGLTYNPNDINLNGVLVLRSSNIKDSILSFEDIFDANFILLKFYVIWPSDFQNTSFYDEVLPLITQLPTIIII